ncbi:MAG: hypothetical protein C5B50_03860 [Verrucomicrobia bacterium]|nr:MAG: hypothetical protein C5B50_03860 [Verrucomicrobiota bacterium]
MLIFTKVSSIECRALLLLAIGLWTYALLDFGPWTLAGLPRSADFQSAVSQCFQPAGRRSACRLEIGDTAIGNLRYFVIVEASAILIFEH